MKPDPDMIASAERILAFVKRYRREHAKRGTTHYRALTEDVVSANDVVEFLKIARAEG